MCKSVLVTRFLVDDWLVLLDGSLLEVEDAHIATLVDGWVVVDESEGDAATVAVTELGFLPGTISSGQQLLQVFAPFYYLVLQFCVKLKSREDEI